MTPGDEERRHYEAILAERKMRYAFPVLDRLIMAIVVYGGETTAGPSDLSLALGMDPHTITRYLHDLERVGLIVSRRHIDGEGWPYMVRTRGPELALWRPRAAPQAPRIKTRARSRPRPLEVLTASTTLLDKRPALTPTLLLLLAAMHPAYGDTCLTTARLADGLGKSPRTIEKHLQHLVKFGMIEANYTTRGGLLRWWRRRGPALTRFNCEYRKPLWGWTTLDDEIATICRTVSSPATAALGVYLLAMIDDDPIAAGAGGAAVTVPELGAAFGRPDMGDRLSELHDAGIIGTIHDSGQHVRHRGELLR